MNIKYHNSKQTKKILFLSEIHDGGEWIATNRLAGAILKSKDVMFSNSLIAFANIKFVNNFFIQASLIKHPTEKRPFSFIKNSIKDFLKLKNELQKSKDKFDIVLVSYYFAMLPLLLARKTKRNNIYYLFHGTRSVPFFSKLGFNYRNLIVLLIEFISLILTKKIIVPSKEAKNFLLLRFKHVLKNKKIYILPNYVPDFFYKRSIKSSEVLSFIDNKISKKLSVITYSGRFVFRKGIENLVQALNDLNSWQNKVILTIAYPSSNMDLDLYNLLLKKIKKLKIENSVFFLPNLKQTELAYLYQKSQLIVLPSGIEMAPLLLIEGLACGTPVLATATGNSESILRKIDKSLILKNNSSDEINLKIKKFLNSSVKEKQQILSAVKKISRDYTKEKTLKNFLRIINI